MLAIGAKWLMVLNMVYICVYDGMNIVYTLEVGQLG
jgi:hypothetical protein